MKKKIFSPLLFMALTLAVSSLFVSCKDYDDDIDSLRLDQTDLLSKLTSLETSVNGQLSSLTASLSSVQTTANDALAKANQAGADITKLQGSVDEVANTAKKAGEAAAKAEALANGAQSSADKAQGSADDAAKAAAAAKEAAGKAQKAADDAMAKANEAFELAKKAADSSTAVDALTKAQSALNQIATINTQIGNLQTLTSEIPSLKTQINNAATKQELGALKETVDAYQKVFDTLFAMATSVELVGSYYGNSSFFDSPELTLYYGNVAETATFGDDEAYIAAAPVQAFVEGDAITPEQGVIIRVNPSNANLFQAEGIGLHIVNSKGESMDDFIKVTSIEKVDDVLLTRGSQLNAGLWKVNFALKEGADLDAFARECYTDYTENHKQVLFAVALNNTPKNNSDRYVASSFDLTMKSAPYKPAAKLNYTVNDIKVGDLKNRVAVRSLTTYALAENGLADENIHEYTWREGVPYAAMSTSTVKQDISDSRVANKLLKVECGEPFTVKLDEPAAAYYYVVLDMAYAIESDVSEKVAWNTFAKTMVGLNTVTKAGESLELTISDEQAKGDIVGFRVFAVNCDGTLLDPDGRAFYVQVNDEVARNTVNVDVTALYGRNASWGIAEIPQAAFNASTAELSKTFEYTDFEDLYKQRSKSGAQINCYLLKSKDKTASGSWQYATNWKEAKYVLVTLNQANLFLDDATFQVVMNAETNTNAVAKLLNELVINVTKKMPTEKDTPVSFKDQQVNAQGIFTAYLNPDNNDWKTRITSKGHNVLTSAVNGLTDDYFTWEFAEAQRQGDDLVSYKVGYNATNNYNIDIFREFVDGKTVHETTCTYTHRNISLTRANGEWNGPKDWVVTVLTGKTIFACPVDPSVMHYQWAAKATTKAIYNTATKLDIATIVSKTDYDGAYNSKNWYEYAYDVNQNTINDLVLTKKVEAHLITKANSVEDEYFSVSLVEESGKMYLSLTPASNTTDPIKDVPSTLRIVFYDVFGHPNNIELGFTVASR